MTDERTVKDIQEHIRDATQALNANLGYGDFRTDNGRKEVLALAAEALHRLADQKARAASERSFTLLWAEYEDEGRRVPDWVFEYCGVVGERERERVLAEGV